MLLVPCHGDTSSTRLGALLYGLAEELGEAPLLLSALVQEQLRPVVQVQRLPEGLRTAQQA